MGFRLGVDLGTTFTAAAVDDGAGARMIGLGNRALQVPSIVYLTTDDTFLVGETAERRAAKDPGRSAREFKRRLGDTVPILLGGQPFSPQALTAQLLAWVVAVVTEREGSGPDEVVVTHPANWGGYKLELMQQTLALADVAGAVILTEPEAAATRYAARANLVAGDKVAVYDLGGGTFDVCVLERQGDGFTILGTPDGVEHLGGIDFDEAVFQHVLGMLPEDAAVADASEDRAVAALTRLRRDCVEAKEALSSDVDTEIAVDLPGFSTTVRLTRGELEAMIASPLNETIAATRRALRSSQLTPEDLDAVVLVGGSSRIPLVSHLLHSEFGVRTAMDTHPKHDIALGAAQLSTTQPVSRPVAATPPAAWPTRKGAATSTPTTSPSSVTPLPSPTSVHDDEPAHDADGLAASSTLVDDPSNRRSPWLALRRGPARRRRVAMIAGAALAPVAIVAAAVGVVAWNRGDEGGGQSTGSAPDSSTSTSPNSPNTDLGDKILPRSSFVVSIHQGEESGFDLFIVDPDEGPSSLLVAPRDQLYTSISPNRELLQYITEDVDSRGADSTPSQYLMRRDPRSQETISVPLDPDLFCGRLAWHKPSGPVAMICHGDSAAQSTQESAPDGTVYTATLNIQDKVVTGSRTRVTAFGTGELSDISFTGTGGLVVSNMGDAPGLYYWEPGAAATTRLTSGPDNDSVGAPNDDRVVFRRDGALYLLHAGGGTPECSGSIGQDEVTAAQLCRLTDGDPGSGGYADHDPTWSWDGRWIMFRRVLPGDRQQLMKLEVASPEKPTPIGPLEARMGPPVWSSR